MGNFLEAPITEKTTEVGEDEGKNAWVGMSCMQGWRAQMEDDHLITLSLPEVHDERARAASFALLRCAPRALSSRARYAGRGARARVARSRIVHGRETRDHTRAVGVTVAKHA